MTFKFTNDQQLAMDTFLGFLAGDDKYMVIQGAAGCGKSTLIKHMVKASKTFCKMRDLLLKEQGKTYQVVLTATTNPAVAVLKELTGMEARTIHSTLGLKVVNNFRNGTTNLKLNKGADKLYNSLVMLDEGSMVNSELFAMIDKQTVDCKIVIIGDQYQLAPVKENATIMENMLVPHSHAAMNKVMRNSGVIMQTGAMFRNTVDRLSQIQKTVNSVSAYNKAAQAPGVFPVIPVGHSELIQVDGPTFQQMMDTTFLDPKHGLHTAKVLAWTNNRVLQYNEYIRKIMGLPEEFELYEKVITNKPIFGRNKLITVDSSVTITGKGIRYEQEEYPGVWGRDVEINGGTHGFLPEDFVAVKTLLNRLASKKNWQEYFKIKEDWLDLRPPHASTVHKSQGSSYNKVFIDLADIGRCGSPTDVARMLYVAISRAREQVILYGALPAKYQGK